MDGSLKNFKNKIYLDYAAATPVDPRVVRVMSPFWSQKFGNPAGLYDLGQEAKLAVESSREKIAALVGCHSEEIVFTAGGTESCNLAIFGAIEKHLGQKKHRPHVVATAIEHQAVLKPLEILKNRGVDITLIDPDEQGFVDVEKIKQVIRPETVFLSVMYANNEIGTIQPLDKIGKWLSRLNLERVKTGLPKIIFHTDACQAAGVLDVDASRLGVDLMSVNGSKIYGPKQTGFLFIKKRTVLSPIIFGGGQEGGLRSGTENVAGIVGLAKALELVQRTKSLESARLGALQSFFISRLIKFEGVKINGSNPLFKTGEKNRRLPNNINFSVRQVEGEVLALYLNSFGIQVSSGSACSTGSTKPSHVLKALGLNDAEAKSGIRISMGKKTTKEELVFFLKALKEVLLILKKTKYFLL